MPDKSQTIVSERNPEYFKSKFRSVAFESVPSAEPRHKNYKVARLLESKLSVNRKSSRNNPAQFADFNRRYGESEIRPV